MNKKMIGIILVVIIIIFVIFFGNIYSVDRNKMAQTFFVDAIYFDDKKYVEIIFEDKSEKSTLIIMEILGMPESYQKTFTESSFREKVIIEDIPQYGWRSTPVTFTVSHEVFGTIVIKTEIHSNNDPKADIIFSGL